MDANSLGRAISDAGKEADLVHQDLASRFKVPRRTSVRLEQGQAVSLAFATQNIRVLWP